VARSLARFGQRKPIVANRLTGEIEAGHHVWYAAQRLEWSEIAVVWVEDDPATASGFTLADNRSFELGDTDDDDLAQWIADLRDLDESGELLEAAGYDADDVEDFLADLAERTDVGMLGTPSPTPADRKAGYDASGIRSVIMMFDLRRYAWVVERLATIRDDLGVDTNADALVDLVAERTGDTPPEVDVGA